MDSSFEDLKGKWKAASGAPEKSTEEIEKIIGTSRKKMKKASNMHIGTLAILSITFIGLVLFFYFLAPLQDTLSHIGIFLMLGGLLLRISIEIISFKKSKQIDLGKSVEKTNSRYLEFYKYRKNIHGRITISILIAYTIGYYLLMPEFGQYFGQAMLIILIISYIPAFMIFGFSIRKSIRDEMRYLDELLEERNKLQ